METTLSLPNKLFYMAEEYTERYGLTRNELYVNAISSFIDAK